jgi:hypothetical protein
MWKLRIYWGSIAKALNIHRGHGWLDGAGSSCRETCRHFGKVQPSLVDSRRHPEIILLDSLILPMLTEDELAVQRLRKESQQQVVKTLPRTPMGHRGTLVVAIERRKCLQKRLDSPSCELAAARR